jgi:hypothetical protein
MLAMEIVGNTPDGVGVVGEPVPPCLTGASSWIVRSVDASRRHGLRLSILERRLFLEATEVVEDLLAQATSLDLLPSQFPGLFARGKPTGAEPRHAGGKRLELDLIGLGQRVPPLSGQQRSRRKAVCNRAEEGMPARVPATILV